MKKNSKKEMYFTIDGNIGAGKSTVIREFQKRNFLGDIITFCGEPIEKWTMFRKFYQAPKNELSSEVYAFETEVQMTRTTQVLNTVCENAVFERSPYLQTFCFAKIAEMNKQITPEQYANLYNHADTLRSFMNGEGCFSIYLDVPVDVCIRRIKERNRNGEEAITTDLLTDIEKRYKSFDYDYVIFAEHKTVDEIFEIINRIITSKISLS